MSLFDDVKEAFTSILSQSTIRLRFRRGTAVDWAIANPILADGEVGFDKDENQIRVGDGTTAWADLVPLNPSNTINTAMQQYVTSAIVTNSVLQNLAAETGYIYVWVDNNNRMVLGVKLDGTVVGKWTVANGSVGYTQLASAVASAIPQSLAPETGYIWDVVDNVNRLIVGARPDGSLYIPKPILGPGSVDTSQLSTSLLNTINNLAPVALPTESGYDWAIVDQNGRLLIGGTPSGNIVAKGITIQDGSISASKLDSATQARLIPSPFPHDVLEVSGSSPNRRVWVNQDSTGNRIPISDGSIDSYNPKFTQDRQFVMYESASGPFYAPVYGGVSYPQYPNARISSYGDSLTASGIWEAYLATTFGITVNNRGTGGEASSGVAMKQGGLVVQFSFDGGQIPADTSDVAVTATSTGGISFRSSAPTPFLFAGSLAGVPGTLSHAQTGNSMTGWTFHRTTAGNVVPVSGNVPFVPDPAAWGAGDQNDIQTFWTGRNNFGGGATLQDVILDTASMVSFLKPYHKRYLVLPPTNALNETPSSTGSQLSNYTGIIGIGQQLAAIYGSRYFDLRNYLVKQAIYDMGLTPTSQDLTDIASDTIPTQLHAVGSDGVVDIIHFTTATYTQIGVKLAAVMRSKGWF